MKQQPDNLFRDKLDNYEKEVPLSAWDRIAAAQPQKKQNRIWLKVAASLLLVAGAGAAWTWTRSDVSTASSLVAVQTTKLQPSVPVTTEVTHPAEKLTGNLESSANARHEESKAAPDTHSSDKRSGQRNTTPPDRAGLADGQTSGQADRKDAAVTEHNEVATRTSPEFHSLMEDPSVPSTESQGAEKILPAEGGAVADTESASQGVTLTYSTKEVAAYLDKNFDGDATDDDKKQSTLKKLLQKANDLKTNQDTFGELRQRKNEILALNFKNDKRGQKTRN